MQWYLVNGGGWDGWLPGCLLTWLVDWEGGKGKGNYLDVRFIVKQRCRTENRWTSVNLEPHRKMPCALFFLDMAAAWSPVKKKKEKEKKKETHVKISIDRVEQHSGTLIEWLQSNGAEVLQRIKNLSADVVLLISGFHLICFRLCFTRLPKGVFDSMSSLARNIHHNWQYNMRLQHPSGWYFSISAIHFGKFNWVYTFMFTIHLWLMRDIRELPGLLFK